jgi:hypothetical protein
MRTFIVDRGAITERGVTTVRVVPAFDPFEHSHLGFRLTSEPATVQELGIGVSGVVSNVALISNLEGAPGNYDLRIYLVSGAIPGCNGGFLYLNLSDANYSAISAYMINAKDTGVTIDFTYFVDSNGFCHIGDLSG